MVLAALAVSAGFPIPNAAGAVPSSHTGAVLLFASGARGGADRFAIESVAADGSGVLRLAAGPNPLESPTFSPDGRTVAFARDLAAVEVVGADGSGERVVANFATSATYVVAFGPIWSPTGASLLVPALEYPGPDPRNVFAQLFAVDVATGSLSRPHVGRYVSYSHDGRYIVYQTQNSPATRGRDVIGVCRPDGSRDVVLGPGSYAAWAPSDDRLAYVSKAGYLTVAGPDNRGRWTLRTMKAGPEAWFPDGKAIAFAHFGPRSGLFLVAPGHKARKLVDIPSNAGGLLTVSPNGRWIALSSDELTFLVRSDGTGLRAIQGTGAAWSPKTAALAVVSGHGLSVWTPAGGLTGVYAAAGLLSEPTWSPDGKRVVLVEGGL
jgi:Tol biopolymer transport system component